MNNNRTNHTKGWYKSWFNEFYLKLYNHRDSKEAKKYTDLAIQKLNIDKNSYILDLCCGSGRHLKHLKIKSNFCFGLDLSMHLLLEAKKNDQSLSLVRANMLFLPFKRRFDAVLSFFTSFGYFSTDKKNFDSLKQINDVLRKNGKLFLDLMNPDKCIKNLVKKNNEIIDNHKVIQHREYCQNSKRINKKIEIIEGKKKHIFNESVRIFTVDETKKMLKETGFIIIETIDESNHKFDPKKSQRMIFIAQKCL